MFNEDIISQRRKKTYLAREVSEFLNFVYSDLLERLDMLNLNCQSAVVIGDDISGTISKKLSNIDKVLFQPDINAPLKEEFDLIICPFSFYSVNEVPSFLLKVFNLLTEKGVFIANFPGHRSLHAMRKHIMTLEQKYKLPHASRIAPFIHFDHCQPLVKQAGFPETIIDMEKIHLEYSSIFSLIKAIKAIGENSTANKGASSLIPRTIHHEIANSKETFIDSVDLISIIAAKNKKNIIVKR